MKIVTYLVTCLNDGNPVDPETREAILAKAWETFGGCTVYPPATGFWVEGETLYREPVERIEIVCDKTLYLKAREWVEWAGKMLDQKAMYFEAQYVDGAEIIEI